MGSFSINLKNSAEHDLRNIDKQYVPKIVEAIGSLAENPLPSQSKKLRDAETSYRLRIGDYRVIYQIDHQNGSINIYHIRHRKDVYKR